MKLQKIGMNSSSAHIGKDSNQRSLVRGAETMTTMYTLQPGMLVISVYGSYG
jgi:hypothetical protein